MQARGVGVGLRSQFQQETDAVFRHVDFLEYNQKGTLESIRRDLDPYIGRLPLVLHSVNLSLGSVQPPPPHRVELLKQVADLADASWVSEHLSFSRDEEIEIESFIALPYTEESVENVAAHIRAVQERIGRPMAMENVTHKFVWPGNEFSEAEFLRRVTERADCGLLLDVTNVYINARIHGYDPVAFLESLPKERVLQLHVAGHAVVNGELMDWHVGGVHPDVLTYTEWALRHTACDAVVIERDNELEQFADLLPDLTLCREIYNRYRQPLRA